LAAAAVVSDTLHLAAAAGWLGGLATLTACPDALDRVPSTLRARPTHGADVTTVADGTRSDQATVWSRWSTCAVTAVCVLAVTGAFQAWRQVPSPDALVGTSYGRLLLVKLCLVAILLALGNSARRALLRARGQGGPRSRLRRSILAELVVGLAVVAVTTLLVGLSPPR
jgi:copper transport protein